MSKPENNRVLCRLGARELTLDEAAYVTAAGFPAHTNVCSVITMATATHTGPGDGDACGDTDFA